MPTLLLARALRARDDMIEPLASALSKLPASRPVDALSTLTGLLGAEEFGLVSHLIAGSYFLDQGINRKLGYPGQEELGYDPDYDEIASVTQRIVGRGPVYVDVGSGVRPGLEVLEEHRTAVGLDG